MSASRDTAIKALQTTLSETLPFFGQPQAALERAYAPGKWCMKEILIHLSDSETVLLDRLRRLVADEKPYLLAFDQDRWTRHLQYKQRDLSIAKSQYEAARRGVIELAQLLPPAIDANCGTHSEAGTRTFAQILKMASEHNAHHLEQIKACAQGRAWNNK